MKKAFCEPGNVDFCPPIAIAAVFAIEKEGAGHIEVKRSEDNGGTIQYKQASDLEADFASEKLHPGDLKASTTAVMVSLLEKLSAGLKADAQKATKDLRAFQKKTSKMKKK